MSENPLFSRALLLTPPGTAAIAVIRLAGPGVELFLERFFSAKPQPGRPVHGILREGDRILDDPVVVQIDPQRADLNLHGGLWVIHSVLDLARRNDFEILGRSTAPLADAAVDEPETLLREVESHLPLARTEPGLRALLAQPHVWRNLQHSFPSLPSAQQKSLIEQCLGDRALFYLLHPPTVAIIGSPNAGKSTLANQLFAQTRSITADLPGTTRDWVGEIADIDGLPVLLIDTAGIHPTEDPLERAAIGQSIQQAQSAGLVLIVLHAARPPDAQEWQLLAQYPEALRIINQCDRPPAWDTTELPLSPSPGTPGEGWGGGSCPNSPLRTIATTGQGIDPLRRRIAAHFQCDSLEISRPRWWTRRQKQILTLALDHPARLLEL